MEGSIRWWSRDHRAHHRYTDTVKDPYSVRKGLLYSHLGWMVFKQNPKNTGRTDITDLNEDPVVVWQHRNFIKCVLFMALIFPTLSAVFSGTIGWVDSSTPLFSPFDDRNSPRDHVITALVTLGEGYHNFHHEFPSDYRNAIEWWQWDPTKWSITFWKWLGLAYDLKQFRANEIEKGRVQQLQKKLDQKRATLNWGTPLEQLPVIGWDDFVEEAKNGKGSCCHRWVSSTMSLTSSRITLVQSPDQVRYWPRMPPPSSMVVSTTTPTPLTIFCLPCATVFSVVDVRLRSGSAPSSRTRTLPMSMTLLASASFELATQVTKVTQPIGSADAA
ncbi:unnamed protein product [Clonostachys rosea f. rosea IK726]|uniref:Uncharacterized protein n=1 Tax=Clonostachys rosea f. rosea IK726 TaxID=1349383 RepID=A0ACA9U9Y1_BIOOC|nr:unnamed protein product [Clonostachys rosea f. rosea IK726]